jgi:hypothetical protein
MHWWPGGGTAHSRRRSGRLGWLGCRGKRPAVLGEVTQKMRREKQTIGAVATNAPRPGKEAIIDTKVSVLQ